MSSVKVSMTIPYFAIGYPLTKEGSIVLNKISGVILDVPITLLRDGIANVFYCLVEILLSIPVNSIKVTKGADSSISLCLLVELRQLLGHTGYHL